LGLAISHRIVLDHGGSIQVDSAPGRTVFAVSLPIVEPDLPT
jgi:nitrogen-specific signal transduction histidine kinase